MYVLVLFNSNGNIEKYEFLTKQEARKNKKMLLNKHIYLGSKLYKKRG